MRALLVASILLAGCASSPRVEDNPPMRVGGPNWDEVDKTVQRVKERERPKLAVVETERTTEAGFFAMTDEEYAAALEAARVEVRKANPNLSDAEVEAEATKRADEAKRRQEASFTRRSTLKYEVKSP
jgi:transketolase